MPHSGKLTPHTKFTVEARNIGTSRNGTGVNVGFIVRGDRLVEVDTFTVPAQSTTPISHEYTPPANRVRVVLDVYPSTLAGSMIRVTQAGVDVLNETISGDTTFIFDLA